MKKERNNNLFDKKQKYIIDQEKRKLSCKVVPNVHDVRGTHEDLLEHEEKLDSQRAEEISISSAKTFGFMDWLKSLIFRK